MPELLLCIKPGCEYLATVTPAHYLSPAWCPAHDPARRFEQINVTGLDQVGPVFMDGAARPSRATTNRILWNRRPTHKFDTGDIDEIVIHNATVHVEQVTDHGWCMVVDLPDGGHWIGNLWCEGDRMFFGQQEQSGFEWDDDRTHEHPDPAS